MLKGVPDASDEQVDRGARDHRRAVHSPVLTSELAPGARFAELAGWPQAERDLAAETTYRFVFRSLYEMRAFNGDPHPGNYLFGGGKATRLDFGLVKKFSRGCGRWSTWSATSHCARAALIPQHGRCHFRLRVVGS